MGAKVNGRRPPDRGQAFLGLNLVAQAGRDRLSGSGDFVSASNTRSTRVIGNSLSVPLFTGGYREAKAGTL